MKTIHKFPLSLREDVTHRLPAGAEIVHVGVDPREEICLWVMLDPNAPKTEARRFAVLGTGGQIADNLEYRGTVRADPFVWHILEYKA